MFGHATDTPTTSRVPVEEAAKLLGITANAVRKRIERGTLRSEREGDTRYVLLDANMPRYDAGMPDGMPSVQILMVERLESEIAFLRDLLRSRDEELRREREAREEAERRRDTIILRMTERIPELEGPLGPQEVPKADVEGAGGEKDGASKGEAQTGSEHRGWLRRFFGL